MNAIQNLPAAQPLIRRRGVSKSFGTLPGTGVARH
jgi:hypothetical protein